VTDAISAPWAASGLAAGGRIAGYRLEEQIGLGGMAVVYRAHDERLDRQVALKLLVPGLAADVAFQQRFIRESRAAAAVDDPNIIPVFEAGEADGILFIAMRLVRGGDLRSLVGSQGPLSAARTVRIVSAVALALDAAHAEGLIHRDVKPANMLLEVRPGRPDHVYLSDFGLSKGSLTSSGLTGSGQFLGTVDYAAPEQIQGAAVDGRTDQYALGCSAFEMLCGQAPFRRDQGLATVYAHLYESPPPLTAKRAGLPAAVDAVFARVLAKSQTDRYASCQEFAEALRAALGVLPYLAEGGDGDGQRHATDLADPDPLNEDAAPPNGVAPDGATPDGVAPDGVAPDGGDLTTADLGAGVTGLAPLTASAADTTKRPTVVAAADPEQSPPRGRRTRALVAGSLLAVVALAAGGWAAFGQSSASPKVVRSVADTLPPHNYPDGLRIVQKWTLSGQRGTRLTVRITTANLSGKSLSANYEEAIPAAVAASPNSAKISYSPVPAAISASRHVVTWQLQLAASAGPAVGYTAALAPDGLSRARLMSLVRDYDALAATLTAPHHPGVTLRSLSVRPHHARIATGQKYQLKLSGVLSNGKAARASQLSGATWTSANPAIASVSSGKVTGRARGTTHVTVRIGAVHASVVVTVTGTGSAPAPGSSTTYSFPPPGSGSSSPVSHPTQTPTPTLTPSPLAQPPGRRRRGGAGEASGGPLSYLALRAVAQSTG
jgi:serine/threonine protein kinase